MQGKPSLTRLLLIWLLIIDISARLQAQSAPAPRRHRQLEQVRERARAMARHRRQPRRPRVRSHTLITPLSRAQSSCSIQCPTCSCPCRSVHRLAFAGARATTARLACLLARFCAVHMASHVPQARLQRLVRPRPSLSAALAGGAQRSLTTTDLDGTLIKTKSGNKFPAHSGDWQWWDASVRPRLVQCHNDGSVLAGLLAS